MLERLNRIEENIDKLIGLLDGNKETTPAGTEVVINCESTIDINELTEIISSCVCRTVQELRGHNPL
jgi:hypothetical protein